MLVLSTVAHTLTGALTCALTPSPRFFDPSPHALPSCPLLSLLQSSGTIGFDELYEFIRGRRHSLDPREKPAFDVALAPPDGIRMDEIAWSADVLR